MAEVEEIVEDVPVVPDPPEPWDWKTEIPDSLKNEKVWESVPNFETLAKNYVDSVKYNVGALKLPKEDAPPEEWDKVYTKLGRPSSPEGYTNPYVDDDEQLDESLMSDMKGVAHVAGLNPKQWDAIATGFMRHQRESMRAQSESMKEAMSALQMEWGGAYNKNLALAQRVVRSVGGEDVLNKFVQSGLANDADVVRFLSKVGRMTAEEGIIELSEEGLPSKDSALEEINKLTASEAYLKTNDPNHDAVVKRVTQLFEFVYN